MSNRDEQIARTRRRVAHRTMRAQIRSFYGLERPMQGRRPRCELHHEQSAPARALHTVSALD